MSKKFLIMEITQDTSSPNSHGNVECSPVGEEGTEVIKIKPSRLIKDDRLRYDIPRDGETYLSQRSPEDPVGGWKVKDKRQFNPLVSRLILDPEPSPKTDLDRVIDEAPVCADIKTWMREKLSPFLQKKPTPAEAMAADYEKSLYKK